MDREWLRRAQQLKFNDPREVLVRLRAIEIEVASSSLPRHVKALRTNELKLHREMRAAALFSLGMSERRREPVKFAMDEYRDYDFVAMGNSESTPLLVPVQLKEVVPTTLNESSSVDTAIEGLRKYADASDLTVVIYLNRRVHFDPSKLNPPKLALGSLWIFGAVLEDHRDWALWGDFMTSETFGSAFQYPAA